MTDVKEYINKGSSVATPTALKKAIQSNEGIDGVHVTVVPVLKTTLNVTEESQVGGRQQRKRQRN